MLPANPLQHLLLQQVARPLVMTSGNPAGKPPALSNQQALDELAGVADVWLLHNREIVQRADDSLVRLTEQGSEMLRRARGYVPDAMPLLPWLYSPNRPFWHWEPIARIPSACCGMTGRWSASI